MNLVFSTEKCSFYVHLDFSYRRIEAKLKVSVDLLILKEYFIILASNSCFMFASISTYHIQSTGVLGWIDQNFVDAKEFVRAYYVKKSMT